MPNVTLYCQISPMPNFWPIVLPASRAGAGCRQYQKYR